MYTGRIFEVGTVEAVTESTLHLFAPKSAPLAEPGTTVAVHGVQLVVVECSATHLLMHTSDETRRRSVLGDAFAGQALHLELPLKMGESIAGHLVQGYVSAVGKVLRVDEESPSRRIWIRPPRRTLDEIRAKGSIAVNGVSLTVAEVSRDRFSVVVVPATLERTLFRDAKPGDRLNLEPDLVSRIASESGGDLPRIAASVRKLVAPMPWSGWVHGSAGVAKVVEQMAAGGAAIVWDPHREGEGDIVVAGQMIRPEHFVFVLTRAFGHTTVPCAPEILERLEIPPMPGAGDAKGTAMHCPVDIAGHCISAEDRPRFSGTGVSAFERAATVARLANPSAVKKDFVAPGHVFPLRAHPQGLSARGGHTEATVALCRAADLAPVGICCEIMSEDGTMAHAAHLERLALEWELPLISIDDLARHI